ncbi:MarR family transcriptional regulator [Streptomyces sp. ZEA17I]|uniref:MarR family transcriptional regulator n=1 Tax=Streptomyces sp. ZEA17I TaxID=2202516 RepID=UPI000D6FA0F3|nr:MarR family transcriptional regulator [Streptomyces sp. ZEA17I]PWS41559.1 MarR family transcriptional regulator [Streptomyces sp. ZEA17I]
MAARQTSSTLQPPALSAAYPMANPGYGKRTAPDELPRKATDFTTLPTRERYVAGFIDHLPEGASMSVKQLAKQLPLYGQQAISSALTALSVAGHLRRVRCPAGAGDETRWVFRTFWSRTARDNAWWTTLLAAETATTQATAPDTAPTPPLPPPSKAPSTEQTPEPTPVPQQRTSPPRPETPLAPSTAETGPSSAYLALARLGRADHRLTLSAADCAALESRATEWLARGVSTDYLTSALTAGLPATIDSPTDFLRHRLTTKIPPQLPTERTESGTTAPTARSLLVECTECGTPGPPEALPDGLCRPCRSGTDVPRQRTRDDGLPVQRDIGAYVSELRGLLKLP